MGRERTLCFLRSSLLSGALISFLLTLEGAVKCRLRHFRLEEDTVLLNFISLAEKKGTRVCLLLLSELARVVRLVPGHTQYWAGPLHVVLGRGPTVYNDEVDVLICIVGTLVGCQLHKVTRTEESREKKSEQARHGLFP